MALKPLYRCTVCSKFQWALGLFHCPARDAMGIDHRSSYVAMAEQSLDSPDIVIGLQKVRSETVAEGMRGDPFGELCPTDRLVK